MPESGIGSQAALAAASLPGFVYPSDLEPSTRWFGRNADVVKLAMSNEGRMEVSTASIWQPAGPGALRRHRSGCLGSRPLRDLTYSPASPPRHILRHHLHTTLLGRRAMELSDRDASLGRLVVSGPGGDLAFMGYLLREHPLRTAGRRASRSWRLSAWSSAGRNR